MRTCRSSRRRAGCATSSTIIWAIRFRRRRCSAPMLDRFVGAIKTFARRRSVPLITFERGQRKDDIVADYRARRPLADGVVVIGVAQEKMRAFKAHKRSGPQGGVTFDFSRQSVAVNHYYFYVQDPDWGPAFLKFGTYVPYPIKLCLNGHEWVKQQLRRAAVAFDSLDNGFLACANPTRLQRSATSSGRPTCRPSSIAGRRGSRRPVTAVDRAAGYTHRLALQQVEVSLTQVFARPVQGRHFFEAVIRENLDLGDRIASACCFRSASRKSTPPPAWGYRTRVITDGVEPSLHVEYKSSHVKQYFKEQRALRTETTINNPKDFYVAKAVLESDPSPAPGRSSQPQGPRSRARQSAVCPDPGRAGPTPTAHRRRRATHLRAPLRRPARHGAPSSPHRPSRICRAASGIPICARPSPRSSVARIWPRR